MDLTTGREGQENNHQTTHPPGQPSAPLSPHRRPSDSSVASDDSLPPSDPRSTKFFIVKPSAGSGAALEAAMSHPAGVWSFPPPTERRLGAAVAAGAAVVVLFSVSGSGAFQGCAAFSGQTCSEGARTGVRLDWLASSPVAFASPVVAQLSNLCDDGRRLQTARDGQELDQGSAATLLLAMGVSLGQVAAVGEARGRRGGRGGWRRGKQAR